MVRYGIVRQFTHYKSQQRDLQCPRLAVGMPSALFLTVFLDCSKAEPLLWNAHYFEMRARNKNSWTQARQSLTSSLYQKVSILKNISGRPCLRGSRKVSV